MGWVGLVSWFSWMGGSWVGVVWGLDGCCVGWVDNGTGWGGNGVFGGQGQGRGARGSFYAAPPVRAGKPSTCLPICLRPPPSSPDRKQIARLVEGEDHKKP